MKTEIYYFTGTGNTLFLARELGGRLAALDGDTVDYIAIAGLDPVAPVSSRADRVGIAFPVYFWDIPAIVRRFMARLEVAPGAYVFALSNCGASDIGVASHARRIARRAGLPLKAAFRFILPDNSIAFPTPKDQYSGMFAAARAHLDEIAPLVVAGKPLMEGSGGRIATAAGGAMLGICNGLLGFKSMRLDSGKCIECGLCAKVCPVRIIDIQAGKPVWKDSSRCTSCFACIHHCPREAIRFRGQGKKGDFQYLNPFVKLVP